MVGKVTDMQAEWVWGNYVELWVVCHLVKWIKGADRQEYRQKRSEETCLLSLPGLSSR